MAAMSKSQKHASAAQESSATKPLTELTTVPVPAPTSPSSAAQQRPRRKPPSLNLSHRYSWRNNMAVNAGNLDNKYATFMTLSVDQRFSTTTPPEANWWSLQFTYREGPTGGDHNKAALTLEVPGDPDVRYGVGFAYWQDNYMQRRGHLRDWIYRFETTLTLRQINDLIEQNELETARAGVTPWETRKWVFSVVARLDLAGHFERGTANQVWTKLRRIYHSDGTSDSAPFTLT